MRFKSRSRKRNRIDEGIHDAFSSYTHTKNATGKLKGGVRAKGQVVKITVKCHRCGAFHEITDVQHVAKRKADEFRRDHFKHGCSRAYRL